GFSRTLLDLHFTTRYIVNQDSLVRSERFARFTFKEKEGWDRIMQKYYGRPAGSDARKREEILSAAKEYTNPHWWTDRPDHTKHMAMEEDTYEMDSATGKPFRLEFDYEVLYKWTSYYVHPTASS